MVITELEEESYKEIWEGKGREREDHLHRGRKNTPPPNAAEFRSNEVSYTST